jgi:hypothetical protein
MNTSRVDSDPSLPLPGETAEARDLRVAREAALLAEGRGELDAGKGIEIAVLEAWLDRLDVDENAPLPVSQDQTPR